MDYENRMKLPLFDDYWIDFRHNTIRRWFQPEIMNNVPCGAYGSMFYDETSRKYRIYYEVLQDSRRDDIRLLKCKESSDLINWTPLLNDGNEILYDGEYGLHGVSVFYDKFDSDPSRRYKLCGMLDMDKARRKETTADWIGVEVAFSADGIHFVRHKECRVFNQTSDALNKIIFNPLSRKYIVFHRAAHVDRRISITESEDLIHWSQPRVILQPSTNYNDGFTGMQHYSLTGNFFDGIFYGLLWRYNTCLYDMDYSRMVGVIEPELVYSYDGQEFLYTSGKPLIERPLPPQPGCCGLFPEEICESADGQYYYILCNGSVHVHASLQANIKYNLTNKDHNIRGGAPLYRIRKDGFCGIESVGPGGLVITKGLALMKDDLSFNIRANAGFARFGIMDLSGKYIDGFSLDDCEIYSYDDSIDLRPKWKKHELKELIGQRIRVVVELNTAILHCISATARPFIRQAQRSFSHPEAVMDDERAELAK